MPPSTRCLDSSATAPRAVVVVPLLLLALPVAAGCRRAPTAPPRARADAAAAPARTDAGVLVRSADGAVIDPHAALRRPGGAPPASPVVSLALGEAHSCAVLGDGTAWCWGAGGQCQIADVSANDHRRAYAVPGLQSVADVVVGRTHACVRARTGSVKCWGRGALEGVAGARDIGPCEPASVTDLVDATALYAADGVTCALRADHTARCWGPSAAAPALARALASLARGADAMTGATLGGAYCAVLASGAARCWGPNAAGQVGDGTATPARASPVAVRGLRGATQIASRGDHTCARLGDGTVQCWGGNASGQLGDGTTAAHSTPVAVEGLRDVVEVAVGEGFSCARGGDGAVRCWGTNRSGELGAPGAGPEAHAPVLVAGLTGATRIAAGAHHACAALPGRGLRCWGANHDGQLGDGTTTDRREPVDVQWEEAALPPPPTP